MPRGIKKVKTTRSAFIRSQPTTMSADDVVRAGKKEGLKINRDSVHKVRWQVKQKEGSRPASSSGLPLDELQRVARRYARKTHAVRGKPGRKPKSLDAQNWADGALEGLLTGFVGLIRTAVRQELRSIINVADAG